MLGWAALVGVACGIAFQLFVGPGDTRDATLLFRLALLLPALVYVAWWLAFPGISLSEGIDEDTAHRADTELARRMELIEASFEQPSVPRSGRPEPDAKVLEARPHLSSSIRRPDTRPDDAELSARFGARRSDGPLRRSE